MKLKLLFTASEDQLYCIEALAFWAGGHHHLPKIYECGAGVCVNFSGDLATWDSNKLTNLVLVAHRYLVRIEIASSGLGRLKVIAHRRKAEGSMSQRHPGLTDLETLCSTARVWLDLEVEK